MATKDHGAFSADGAEIVEYSEHLPSRDDPETSAEAEQKGPSEAWQFWSEEIRASHAAERRFREEGIRAEKDYFGQTDKTYTDDAYLADEHKTNTIHASIEVLKPLVFSDKPIPIIRRRYGGDGDNDPTDRIAAMVAQRFAEYLIDTSGFIEAVEMARDDWLIPGRGSVRVRYKADIEKIPLIDPATGQQATDPEGEPVFEERKRKEKIVCRHWHWRRVFFSATNSWDENRWIGYEAPFTKRQVKERFGPKIAEAMTYPIDGLKNNDARTLTEDDAMRGWSDAEARETSGTPSVTAHAQCLISEIWDKEARRIIWWSPHYRDDVIEAVDDIYGIEDFFDTPKPLLAVTINGQLTPRPDIAFYRARAEEIDQATKKLSSVLKSISVSGVYAGKHSDEIDKLLKGDKNRLVPIEEWMAFMEKGGLKGAIDWLPMEPMIVVARAMIEFREQSKMQLYEISGISDIVRGQGDAKETATAQNIKANYAGMRLRDRQRKIHIFALGLISIMLDIGFELFDTATIKKVVAVMNIPDTEADLEAMNTAVQQAEMQYQQALMQYQQAQQIAAQMEQQGQPAPQLPPPPEPQKVPHYEQTSWERIHATLRDDRLRKFILSLDTNGTILTDPEEDKKQRVEFLSAFTDMVSGLFPMAQSGMIEMKLIKELLLFTVRGFPRAQTLEGMLSSLPDELNTQPQEDPRIAVANITGEMRKQIEEMKVLADAEQGDKERAHEVRLKGVEVMADMMTKGIDAANQPAPEPPQEPPAAR